jgi:hypothetical protein
MAKKFDDANANAAANSGDAKRRACDRKRS